MKLACHFSSRLLIIITLLVQSTVSICQKVVPEEIYNLYDEVVKYVNNLPKETELHPPSPPSTYYDYCFPCDKERQAVYIRDSISFINEYMGEEMLYMKKSSMVMDYFNERRLKKQPFDSLTFLKMSPRMLTAKIVIAQRMQNKLAAAWKQYYNQPDKVPFLITMMLKQHRINALVGLDGESPMPSTNILPQLLINAAANRLAQATKERDYPILLNIDWIIQMFRSATALGLYDKLPVDFSKYQESNQFLFIIETKAKTKFADGTMSAALSSKLLYVAKPDSNCRLKWTLASRRKRIDYHLDDIAIEAPPHTPKYVGKYEVDSREPEVKLDFCKEDRDTVHFYGFQIAYDFERWEYESGPGPGSVVLTTYTIAFPDTRPFQEYVHGGVVPTASIPFGFHIKQQPRNKEAVIVEQTINSKDVSKYANVVIYGEFKLKIEHVE